ncbi:GH36-type glycosyl hydrolase domain-containing protein [Caldisalinibacter kiritimatiensis]|uniref:Cyclic beta-1,2-glucan synthase n=1 Tax=Caldisalinibacter kiritimatiensis TaxID=1304284 RepID=R1AX09_9FIRM|nr:cyclic beta 1-2 glucan synthetase [Caldisalinibacter kiritimatiensis]EOD01197.1 Cyclic beta-1,2-glucan synthase [Caldisalinibacter kiritimatiensis]
MTEARKFKNKYGYFTDDGREYVITEPKTPKPWANIISNGDYSLMISQTGGGYSWRGNAGQNRITRSMQDIIKDPWGKYVYIRDVETKEFWSAAWKPVMADYEYYEVRHGIGYSIFNQKINGIKSKMKVFVVPDAPVEIIEITLANESERKRILDVTTFFEWGLGFAPDEHREFHKIFIDSKYEDDINGLLVDKYLWGFPDEKGRNNNISWEYTAFHAVSERPKSYDGDKESFIGIYGHESCPRAMKEDKLAQRVGRFVDASGSLQVELELKKGESKTVVFTIGAAMKSYEDPKELANKYTNVEAAQKAFEDVHKFWSQFIDTEEIKTPDEAMNIMTNVWLKYQSISCRLWGKSAYYQTSAGYGYRDQLQDSQIFLISKPEYTKKQILMHAEQQFNEGDVLHWWFTIRGGGPRTKCSDDLLWLPFILEAYLKETKDFTILDERVSFLDGGRATVYEHCKRAIERAFHRFSPRGIPLMGDHDWNDGLSAIGNDWKGESFWVGEFLYEILKEFISIARERGDYQFADKCKIVYESLKENLNKYGWDGEWYLQATTDHGLKVGSKENEEGKIFLNPQIWAVISGIADKDRAKKAMEAVTKYLLKDYGTLLLYPAYTKVRNDIGYITRYAPGLRENGGVYTHAATWSVWAYTLIGESELAYEAYKRICPPNRSDNPDGYMCEPYVTPGNTDGPLSPYYGRGGWTWYTGSSQWLHRVATHWILGVRPTYEGLLIDPSIPKEWDGFTYRRQFRGATYLINVNNSAHVNRGIKEIYVDGKLIENNVLPDFKDGKEHRVKVLMG